MQDIVQKYSNDEITIVWKPSACMHSALCWKGLNGLPEVFKPTERPWIQPLGSTSAEIIKRINACPSGALSFYSNNEEAKTVQETNPVIIEPTLNGPLLVHGQVIIKDHEGKETPHSKVCTLCRCGASANKPYCDGSHNKINFKG